MSETETLGKPKLDFLISWGATNKPLSSVNETDINVNVFNLLQDFFEIHKSIYFLGCSHVFWFQIDVKFIWFLCIESNVSILTTSTTIAVHSAPSLPQGLSLI